MKKHLLASYIISLFTLTSCASAPMINLTQEGTAVSIGKSDPQDNYKDIGPITAIDGKSCGAYGYRGTYNRAIIRMKNKASQLGGDYVQILSLSEPHLRGGCFDNTYKINGTLFKKVSDHPTPVRVKEEPSINNIEKLRNIKSLLDDKIITQEEFDSQKAQILKNGLY